MYKHIVCKHYQYRQLPSVSTMNKKEEKHNKSSFTLKSMISSIIISFSIGDVTVIAHLDISTHTYFNSKKFCVDFAFVKCKRKKNQIKLIVGLIYVNDPIGI